MQPVDGQKHFFGAHPPGLDKPSPYSSWVKNFRVISEQLKERGIEVVNCSPVSALKCFPIMTLEEALAR